MILSTLVTKREIIGYLLSTMFVLLFGGVYELFSHNINSLYMKYAFLIPFIGFVLLSFLFLFKIKTNSTSRVIISLSIMTFTIYSILKGVLEIYGTTNKIINIYIVLGVILLLIGVLLLIFKRKLVK